MSFVFTIKLMSEDALSEDELKDWHPNNSRVRLFLNNSMFSKRGTVLSVGPRVHDLEDLLTEKADPNAKFWDIHTALLPDLAELLKAVRENTKSCFTLEAYWFGERSSNQNKISIEELVQIIEQGKISTKTNFLVC
jgi:hypothetical protein